MGHSFSTDAKFFEKLWKTDALILTLICAYQGLENVSVSENFAYVLNQLSVKLFVNQLISKSSPFAVL